MYPTVQKVCQMEYSITFVGTGADLSLENEIKLHGPLLHFREIHTKNDLYSLPGYLNTC